MGRGDLTSEEWSRLKPHLPKSGQRGGRWASHRRIINGILYRLRTGVPWRDLPARFGPWKTVYERHRRWSADSTWDRIFAAVLADADQEGRIDWSMVSVDSTSCWAHQHAAGALKSVPRVPGKAHAPAAPLRRGAGTLPGRSDLQDPSRRRGRTPPLALLITWASGAMPRSSSRSWNASASAGQAADTLAPGQATSAAIRRIHPAATVAICDDTRSSTPSLSRRISGPTGKPAAARAADPLASTRRSTSAETKWSGRSMR